MSKTPIQKGVSSHQTRLKDHCSRWTIPRDEIFNVLIETQQHLSAKEIYHGLQATHPDIGLTTVYRTLELLDRPLRHLPTRRGTVRPPAPGRPAGNRRRPA
jgi:hypothetical protein